MTTTKMTYSAALTFVAENFDLPEDVAERIESLKVQLDKRNTKRTGKPTKTQRENAEVKDNIANLLVGKQMQCKSVAKKMGISPQKCSALLTQLVKEGRVERIQEKKSAPALFSVPDEGQGE